MRYSDGKRIALYAAIGSAISEQRKASGLSYDVCADAVGISRSSLRKIEAGDCCSLHTLVRLAEVFDCTLDSLVPVLTEMR